MTKQYDLAIIGTGTVAMTAAMRVRAAGGKLPSPIFGLSGAPVHWRL